MRLALSLLLAPAVDADRFAPAARAQDSVVYVVNYIDVAPANPARRPACCASSPLRAARTRAIRASTCCSGIGPSNQFAIVAVWKDQKAYTRIWPALAPAGPARPTPPRKRSTTGCTTAWKSPGRARRSTCGAIFVVTHGMCRRRRRTNASRRSRPWWRIAARSPAQCATTSSSKATGPTTSSVVEIWKEPERL